MQTDRPQPRFSIIIPTLNEIDSIEATVGRARITAAAHDYEIVVADSGSSDGTVALARGLDTRVVVDAEVRCRAEACNLGAGAARGEIFVFLDADTRTPNDFLDAIEHVLRRPGTIGGAFEFALTGRGLSLRVIELINRIRYRIWRRYYGDQMLFVRADDFRAVGGFPARRILESSDLCLLLARRGRLRLVRQQVLTSSRRFLDGGVWRVFGSDIWIWFLDLIGLKTDRFGARYWNYNRLRGQSATR